MWNLLIVDPMVNALVWLYGILGNNYLIAIILLTVLIRLLIWPLTASQQKSSARMQELQPKIKELREKYADNPEKQQQKMMELYREAGVNPVGGCLPMVIQFPLLIGMYQGLRFTLASAPLELIQLSQHIYTTAPAFFPDAPSLIPLDSRVLWLDLSQPDPLYILTVLTVITTFLQSKLITPPNTDPNTAGMTSTMQLIMPVFVGFYSTIFPSGLAIYWVVSNVVGIAQYSAMGRASLKNLLGTEDGTFNLQKFLGLPEPATEPSSRGRGRSRSGSSRSRKRR